MRLTLPLLLAWCLGACQPVPVRQDTSLESVDEEATIQANLVFEQEFEQQQRLTRVAFPLLTGAVDMCPDTSRYIAGLAYLNQDMVPAASRAIAVLHLTDRMQVSYVVPGSPADRAGIRANDQILAVDGDPVPVGKPGVGRMAADVDRMSRSGRPVTFRIRTEDREQDVVVQPVLACAFGVTVFDSDAINATTDDATVYVNTGMLRFAPDDLELSFVISHELGHLILRHPESLQLRRWLSVLAAATAQLTVARQPHDPNTSIWVGKYVDQWLNEKTPLRDLESQADGVGLCMMARAGLPVKDAVGFWRKLATVHPESPQAAFGGSHPTDARRVLAIQSTLDQLADAKDTENGGRGSDHSGAVAACPW